MGVTATPSSALDLPCGVCGHEIRGHYKNDDPYETRCDECRGRCERTVGTITRTVSQTPSKNELTQLLSHVHEDSFFGLRVGEMPEETFVYAIRFQSEGNATYHEIIDSSMGTRLTWGHRSQTTRLLADVMLRIISAKNGVGNEAVVDRYGEIFYEKIVSRLPRNRWDLSFSIIRDWMAAIDQEYFDVVRTSTALALLKSYGFPGTGLQFSGLD